MRDRPAIDHGPDARTVALNSYPTRVRCGECQRLLEVRMARFVEFIDFEPIALTRRHLVRTDMRAHYEILRKRVVEACQREAAHAAEPHED